MKICIDCRMWGDKFGHIGRYVKEIALTPIVLLAFLETSYFYANNKIYYIKRKSILDKIMELAIVHK